jgi:hypothetical protein
MEAIKRFLAPIHGLMYTTSWGIIFFGMPATPIALLLIASKESLSFSDAARATGAMVTCEAVIAIPLLLTAKWLSGPKASAWWKFWRV